MDESDEFDELMTWAITKFAGDREFLRELLDRFDPRPASMTGRAAETLEGMFASVLSDEQGVCSSEFRGTDSSTGEDETIALIVGKGVVGAAVTEAVHSLIRGEVVELAPLLDADAAEADATNSE